MCTFLAGGQVRIIDLSWSNPTISFLQKNLAAMEKDSPLDGITIRIRGDRVVRNGKKYFAGESLWTNSKVEFKHFAKDIAALKKLPFKKFTDNFYYSTTFYYDLDWYNDAQWAQSAANFGVAARVCRAAGLKGILFDIEEYGKRFWDYSKLADPKQGFRETRKIAYKRGQQWGKEVFKNFPEIILFMPFMFSMYSGNLSAPFINGILSVMPPSARIIEGYESDGYRAGKPEDYACIAAKFYRNATRKATPENRNKYLAQVELSPAFYIDSIVRHKRFTEQKKECGGVNNFMKRNIAGAMKEARSYIWFYSEQGCWWKNSVHPRVKQTWEEQVPGITQAVRDAVSRKFVAKKENLLKNPDLKNSSGWYAWQREIDQKKKVPGTITVGNGKVVFKKVKQGCLSQNVPVKPGEYYLFQFRGANRSSGAAGGFIAFKDKNGKWMDYTNNFSVTLPATGKFEDVSYLFAVPQDAYFVSVQISAGSQGKGKEDEIIYTGVQLLKY